MQAGLAEVRLVSVPAGVLAVSDQILLLRHNPNFDTEYARPGTIHNTNCGVKHTHNAGSSMAFLGMYLLWNTLSDVQSWPHLCVCVVLCCYLHLRD